jgi:hypothetical protein
VGELAPFAPVGASLPALADCAGGCLTASAVDAAEASATKVGERHDTLNRAPDRLSSAAIAVYATYASKRN